MAPGFLNRIDAGSWAIDYSIKKPPGGEYEAKVLAMKALRGAGYEFPMPKDHQARVMLFLLAIIAIIVAAQMVMPHSTNPANYVRDGFCKDGSPRTVYNPFRLKDTDPVWQSDDPTPSDDCATRTPPRIAEKLRNPR
jgi:hypothetical protein